MARASGSLVTLTVVGEGSSVVVVTAIDPGGLTATQAFTVTVLAGNQPPEAVGTLPDVRLPALNATQDVNVSAAFEDADGDAVTSSAPDVVAVRCGGRPRDPHRGGHRQDDVSR